MHSATHLVKTIKISTYVGEFFRACKFCLNVTLKKKSLWLKSWKQKPKARAEVTLRKTGGFKFLYFKKQTKNKCTLHLT